MIQSVQRAVQILQCFEEQQLLGVTQISEMVQLNKSTTFGLITTLTSLGLLEQDAATGRYRLGLELYRMGTWVDADERRIVLPELTTLTETLGETINYVRPDGSDVVYLVKKESSHSMRICTKDGQRLPMYCTAVGKAILAYLPPDEQEQIINSFRYRAYTEYTVTDSAALRASLAEIHQNGYAFDKEELEYGLVCVAVPLFNQHGRPIAAISCSGPKVRMTSEKIAQCLSALRASVNQLKNSIV